MPPEWSSGFEVKLEKSETPSTESQDEVKLEQDENENNVGEIKNNFENQDMQRILVDEEEILKPEGNNPCRPEGEAECASFACDQCGYFSNQEAHLELHKKYKNHGVGSLMCDVDQLLPTCKHLKSTRKGFMMKHVISVQIVIMKAEDSVAFKKHVEYSHAAENTFVISVNSNILC